MPIHFQRCHFQNGCLAAILHYSVSRLLTLVWRWISSPNFSSKLVMDMETSPLIFSNVAFKMAVWQPYWIFQFYGLKLQFGFEHQIQTSVAHYLCVWVDRSLVILNDVQLQSMHCPLLPLLLDGGILVDHWPTISSEFCLENGDFSWKSAWKWQFYPWKIKQIDILLFFMFLYLELS